MSLTYCDLLFIYYKRCSFRWKNEKLIYFALKEIGHTHNTSVYIRVLKNGYLHTNNDKTPGSIACSPIDVIDIARKYPKDDFIDTAHIIDRTR